MKFVIYAQQGMLQYDEPPTRTIGELKANLRQRFSFSPRDPIHILRKAVYIKDDQTLADIGLPEGGTLIMLLRLQGLF
jgi:hypothetical protein